eukprot:29402_1
MDQDKSKPLEMSEASLNTWQQLMQMEFDDNISLEAVERNGTNIDQQNMNASHQKTQDEIKTDDTETYNDRIDNVFQVVQSQPQDIYSLVEKEYANKKGIDGFIEDCGEYVMNIDSIYADNVNKCELDG